jgi:hypothetical protein
MFQQQIKPLYKMPLTLPLLNTLERTQKCIIEVEKISEQQMAQAVL